MYDRTKHLCLTDFEACEIGKRAAAYVGVPQRDVELFGAVFQHMIESFVEQLKVEAPAAKGPPRRKPKASDGNATASLP